MYKQKLPWGFEIWRSASCWSHHHIQKTNIINKTYFFLNRAKCNRSFRFFHFIRIECFLNIERLVNKNRQRFRANKFAVTTVSLISFKNQDCIEITLSRDMFAKIFFFLKKKPLDNVLLLFDVCSVFLCLLL